jgi:hydrogenase nickel incorporation protein HypA/HybF
MHELAVTKGLVKIVLDEVEKRTLEKVREVVVVIGELTTYSGESVKFYYDMLKQEDERISESTLVVEVDGGRIRCKKCGDESDVSENIMLFCSHCNTSNVEVVSGKDFIVKSVKV